MLRSSTFAGVILVFLTGCGTEPTCTQGVEPAIVVEIRDGFDGTPLAGSSRGAVQEGQFVDSLRPYGSFGNGVLISRAAADERPGVYTVTVEHDGYLTWRVEGVRVQRGSCNVETVQLTAGLQPAP
ncbi:MAG TPA: hypothetical protein VFH26_01985 [Gemmatimonadales bacterium]|nr:hypothetical protein [Gemmatimonadales bacterium]